MITAALLAHAVAPLYGYAGSATHPDAVVRVDLASGVVETLRRGSTLEIDDDYISVA